MRKIRQLALLLALLCLAAAGGLYYQTQRFETGYIFASDLAQYVPVSEADLQPITVPLSRDYPILTDKGSIVGQYTRQAVYAGQPAQTALLSASLPSGQRSFPAGLLPVDTRAYPVEIPANIAGTFQIEDQLDLFLLLPEADGTGRLLPESRMVVVFQKVPFLGEVTGKYFVALTLEQIAAYEGIKSWASLQETAQFTAAITQPANGDVPPLYEISMQPADASLFGSLTAKPGGRP